MKGVKSIGFIWYLMFLVLKRNTNGYNVTEIPPGQCRNPIHSAANTRPLPLDSEEEVQALSGAASRPSQAQDFAPLEPSWKVGVPGYSFQSCKSASHSERCAFEI